MLFRSKDKINRSRALIAAIDKRHSTLESIAAYLMEQQSSAIFEDAPPKPLSMTRLASQLGISPSTITRAVSGKYYQCPKGTYLLRGLFVFGETEGDSESVGREGVKKKLKEIIKGEGTPLSDEKLAKILSENGFEIKRRTVAKYREELGIPPAKSRGVAK